MRVAGPSFGPTPLGSEGLTFHRYIERHRPPPKGMHFNDNSWWTSPVPFREGASGLMKQYEVNFYQKYGVALDSFTIDMGWSDSARCVGHRPQVVSREFSRDPGRSRSDGLAVGLWTSPSYPVIHRP